MYKTSIEFIIILRQLLVIVYSICILETLRSQQVTNITYFLDMFTNTH